MIGKSGFREENLYSIWEKFCKSRNWSKDLRLQGLYAGELNRFEGPDYQGAEFELDGKVYRGDVEIHRQANEWYLHRHHLDRRYDNVVLHLVWDNYPLIMVCNTKMREVITLNLRQFPDFPSEKDQKVVCQFPDDAHDMTKETLGELALKRLKEREVQIKRLVESHSYDQVLYILLMRILGSPNNVRNFEHFSCLLPWERLISIKQRYNPSLSLWMAFFLNKSGLIARTSSYAYLKNLNHELEAIDNTTALSPMLWQLSGQRPRNNPVHHLQILAHWIHKFPHQSLYYTLKQLASSRFSFPLLFRKIQDLLSSPPPRHVKKNEMPGQKQQESQWGRAKIIEIIGNAVIPFLHWEAAGHQSYGFCDYLEEFFFFLPTTGRYAKLERFKKLSSFYRPYSRGFYINQALLFLQENFCKTETCHACPLMSGHKGIDKNL
jgi:hypothetical protein